MTCGGKRTEVLTADEQQALLMQCTTRYKMPHRNLCMMRVMLEGGGSASRAEVDQIGAHLP